MLKGFQTITRSALQLASTLWLTAACTHLQAQSTNLPANETQILTFERPFYNVGAAPFANLPRSDSGTTNALALPRISKADSHSGAQSLEVPSDLSNYLQSQGGVEISGPTGSPLALVRFIDFWIKPAASKGSAGLFSRPTNEFTVRAGNVLLSFEESRPGWGQFLWLHNLGSSRWEYLPVAPLLAGSLFPLTKAAAPASQSVNVSKDWIRITLRENLVTGLADIYLNAKLAAVNVNPWPPLPYVTTAPGTKTSVLQVKPSNNQNSTFIDDVQVTAHNPLFQDSDDDGMPDTWELQNHLSPILSDRDLAVGSPRYDTDHDGLEAIMEYALGTKADDRIGNDGKSVGWDSDLDGIPDGWEVESQLNPHFYSDANYIVGANNYTNRDRFNEGLPPLAAGPPPSVDPTLPATYYVRANATNLMDGTAARPFNTIQPAINIAKNGDSVILDGSGGPF
jgi:hypothetical protein